MSFRCWLSGHDWGAWLGGRDTYPDFYGYRERECEYCGIREKQDTTNPLEFDRWVEEAKEDK